MAGAHQSDQAAQHRATFPRSSAASSGPGWALVGDAGHFKDPVIAQGIRDAVRFGRLLGEQAAPHFNDPQALDAALLRAERRRDLECQGTYHWGNRESRATPSSSLFVEVLRHFGPSLDPGFTDAFNRNRTPDRVFHLGIGAKALIRAAARPGADRRALLREVVEELRIDFDIHRERRRDAFRSAQVTRSERPLDWPHGGAKGTKVTPAAPALNGSEARRLPPLPRRPWPQTPTMSSLGTKAPHHTGLRRIVRR